MSLLTHTLFEDIGSKFHYLYTDGNPFGIIFEYVIYEGSLYYIIKDYKYH